MIREQDLYTFMKKKVPGIQQEFTHAGDTTCSYKIAAFFATFTKKLINSGDLKEAQQCFEIAEELLRSSDYSVRNAIENVYIYSVSQALTFDHSFNYEFPLLFKKAYRKQLDAASI